MLHSIYQKIWKTQQWPQDWKRSIFIPIPKKGNAKECSDYHTIALISHLVRLYSKSFKQFQQYVNQELQHVQAGFRKGRRIRDQIANILWIKEKAREFQKNIYFCFIGHKKAFAQKVKLKVLVAKWYLTLVTSLTTAHQAPLPMEFSRIFQEYWRGLPFHSPGDPPDQRIKPCSPTLEADSVPSEPDYVNHSILWKILKETRIPDNLTCLLRKLYVGQEATVRTLHRTTDWL